MRLALISDIHGNALALDAVLSDAHSAGIDETWFLGDFSAIGPDPVGVLDRVSRVEGARYLRGNTDRYAVSDDRPPPSLSEVRNDPTLIETYASISASFAWTRGYVSATGWFDWLASLPLESRATVHDTRILAVHATPGTDDGIGIHPGQGDADIAMLLDGCDADIVVVGHTHEPMLRRLPACTLVNLGCVSNPRSGDLRASYAILDVRPDGATVEHRRVAYDHDAFARRVVASRHPAAAFILAHQRNEIARRPPHADHVDPVPGVRTLVRGNAVPTRPGAS